MLPDNPRLGVIGFGEVGSNISKGLKQAGIAQIIAYANGPTNRPPYTKAFKQKAQNIGVKLASTLKELAQDTDLIFSAVFPKMAAGIVREAAPFFSPSHLYVDLNSCSAEAKQEGYAILKERGVRYVDSVLLGGPLRDEHRVQIFAAGEGAEEFRDTMNKYGMEIRVISDRVGDAALLKMIHSVLTKGIQALLWESFLALHKAGLDPKIYDGLRNWVDEMGLLGRADRVIAHSAIHARRRAGEMEFVADTMRSLGVEPMMTEAAIQRLAWCAGFNFRDYFSEGLPSGYKATFEVMDRIIKERGQKDKPTS